MGDFGEECVLGKMYRNQTLRIDGDSIWGRITLLLSLLIGRPCTGVERARFYEDLLLKSLEKQEKDIPLQDMIDDMVVLLNRKNDGHPARKFISLIRNLRKATNESDEIIRFLLLLSKIDYNYAGGSHIEISSLCSGSKILSTWKRTVNNCMPNSVVLENRRITPKALFFDLTNIPSLAYQSRHDDIKAVTQDQLYNSEEASTSATVPNESTESYEKIQRTIVDRRGRIHPRACDPELRSLCKLKVGSVFYTISWWEYLRCLAYLLMGAESILFRKNVDGFFIISRKTEIFLELEDINLLPRLALPFLDFANRLLFMEQFIRDSVEVPILQCEMHENVATKALLNLKLYASEQLWKFRDGIRNHISDKKECDVENIRTLLQELLHMCFIFNHFVDVMLHIQAANVRDGIENSFLSVSGKNESVGLKPSILISKSFLEKWLFEGRFRKLILTSPSLKSIDSEEESCVTVKKLLSELSDEEILKALRSTFSSVAGPLLDFHFQKVYLSRHNKYMRRCIIDDFKQSARLLRDVYLCHDNCITEVFVSAILNEEDDLDSNVDDAMNYLLNKNYSSVLVHGFFQLTSSFDKQIDLKVCYKSSFPLNTIFTPSVLANYDHIWKLLLRIAVECTALEEMMVGKACVYNIALMQMRMWNFVRALRCFFHEQINMVVKEYQAICEKIVPSLSFGSKSCEVMECIG
uniref:Gamma tubulin complex component C-terminal domain-containing protein n=1 Tax=Setaria digitata TaxID=48799 RepID=A0A915PWW1_9BILA